MKVYDVPTLVDKMLEKKYLLDMGKGSISKRFNVTKEEVIAAKRIAKNIIMFGTEYHPNDVSFRKIYRRKSQNILVIGDTHVPYEKEGYLEFCKEQYDKYNCDTVVHIGDLIDSHATSRHPSVPEAYSPGDELYYTKLKLKSWYKTFPNMKVVIGNHDIRAYKIAADSKISTKWLRGFSDVLGVPTWEFQEYYEINDTIYLHGMGTSGVTSAYRRALNLGQNVVMGHLHSDASILYHKLPNKTIWGMIVGCGVDSNSYGMNYSKNDVKKSIISCGIVVDNQPIIIVM